MQLRNRLDISYKPLIDPSYEQAGSDLHHLHVHQHLPLDADNRHQRGVHRQPQPGHDRGDLTESEPIT